MTIDSVILFEDIRVESLYPFSIMHAAWELRCGAFRSFERVQRIFPDSKIFFSGRDKIVKSFKARFTPVVPALEKENVLVLYSGLLHDSNLAGKIIKGYDDFKAMNGEDKSVVFMSGNKPVAGFIPAGELINPTQGDVEFLPRLIGDYSDTMTQIYLEDIRFMRYLWDALDHNAYAIADDLEFFKNGISRDKKAYKGVYFVNEGSISLGENSTIKPGVVIDASDGPVIIGNDVTIMPNAVITGPCFIGDRSIIKIGAKIYGGTSIGELCKVGGEVENSIIHAYSNKQHDGFLGRSYLSEWVNLGADTNTSDLKNTYGEIKVRLENLEIDSGRMFLGLLCGDHTKSGINTMFTTGTVAGICGNIFGGGYPPHYLPSYMWGGVHDSSQFILEKALEIADTVMRRRGKTLLPEEKAIMEDEFRKSRQHYLTKQ